MHRLVDIAAKFGLKRSGGISTAIAKLKVLLKKDEICLINQIVQYDT